jgi:exopolysaccharide biosynthesis predicted pyruvyltransferase EpsI
MDIKNVIKSILRPYYRALQYIVKYIHIKNHGNRINHAIANDRVNKIFYLGVTEHSNLGDLAQYYCIKQWIADNYPEYAKYEFEATTVVDTRFGFIEKLKKAYGHDDIIIFQSGYTTQDLGGVHDLMHRVVIDNIPHAKILMMPQTIFFKKEENKIRTANSYNQAKNMLFLARDHVSYGRALEMFPDVTVKSFPDIVTSLIGHFDFGYKRNGVLICRRNDGEKFYAEDEIMGLKSKIENIEKVFVSDTTIKVSYKKIKKNLKDYIEGIIEAYSKYKIIITDRYHGTIFSMAANTPVIVIKTNDHKVTTGVDWFKGVYDNKVFLAESIEHALELTKNILDKRQDYTLEPHFDVEYYSKLKSIFEKRL